MIIQTRNLTKKVTSGNGELTILEDINLELEEGRSLAIVGPSGSGKSTLLGLLAGLDSPTEGEIFLNNQPLHKLSEEERALARKKNVAFVFQSFELLPGLSALENVMLPSELNLDSQAKERATELRALIKSFRTDENQQKIDDAAKDLALAEILSER